MTPEEKLRSVEWRISNSSWLLSPIFLCGFGTSISFFYIGNRARRESWTVAGGIYACFTFFCMTVITASDSGANAPAVAFLIMEAAWLVGIVHALIANRRWLQWKAHNPPAPWGDEGITQQGASVPGAPSIDHLLSGRNSNDAFTPIATTAQQLDINTASLSQLQAIGLSESQAENVIRERTHAGHFRDPADLMTRAGVPPHVFAGISQLVVAEIPRRPPRPRSSGRRLDI